MAGDVADADADATVADVDDFVEVTADASFTGLVSGRDRCSAVKRRQDAGSKRFAQHCGGGFRTSAALGFLGRNLTRTFVHASQQHVRAPGQNDEARVHDRHAQADTPG